MTETADKLKDTQACGDIAKVFEPSETVSIMSPVVEAASEIEVVPASLQHLDSEIHAIFGESEMTTDEISSLSEISVSNESVSNESGSDESGSDESGSDESGSDGSGSAESGAAESGAAESGAAESGAAESGAVESSSLSDEMTASQEVRAIMRSVADEEGDGFSLRVASSDGEALRDASGELPDNPEVSARLTNLSLRHAGARPAWFDFEPVALSGRTRQCREIFWRIATDHAVPRKRMMALLASSGMGKTAFLAELYAMLEHAPHNVLTLAPGAPAKKPFQALKNILEQRFYISGDASFERISQFVTGAVKGIVGAYAGDAVASEVTAGILGLWRVSGGSRVSDGSEVVPLDANVSVEATQKTDTVLNDVSESDKTWAGQSEDVSKPKMCSVPPPLPKHVSKPAEEEQKSAGQKGSLSSVSSIQAIPLPQRTLNSVPPIAPFKRSLAKAQEASLPEVPSMETALQEHADAQVIDEWVAEVVSDVEDVSEVAKAVSNEDNDVNSSEKAVESLGGEPHAASCDVVEASDEGGLEGHLTTDADVVAVSQEDLDARELCHLYDGMSMETARQAISLVKPLIRLLEADLKRDAQVVVLDDVERFDIASLVVISRVFEGLGDVPLSIVMTSQDMASLPVCLQCCEMDEIRLRSLSDSDLAHLTHDILKKLSASREKMIVPKDMCMLIAQRSFGSPRRAQELTLKHFTPERMIHWNDAIEQLRHEPLPRELAIELVRRIRECSPTARTVLQFAAYLNAPFTASTLECILSGWEESASLGKVDCHQLLKKLRTEGYLERTGDSVGGNTPTYVFKHECERLVIAGTTPRPMRHHVYGTAAQWYALNNHDDNYDESIGDLWRSHRSYHEACRYYERAAYRARQHGQLQKAWPLFRKLLKTLPADCMAQRIQYSLDGAAIAFRLGHIDEAFRLCRLSSHHALKLSAYNQAARAHVLIASMLIEIGSVRHVLRYTARANSLLNCEGDVWTRCHLYNVLTRRALMMGHHKDALKWHLKALEGAQKLHLSPNERLLLEWTDAEIEANYGNPKQALERLSRISEEARILGCSRLQALACRSQGLLYARFDDIDKGLEALNVALGMAQEMNDIILHANLLSDISEGALALEARRTARSTTEVCLGMAQQTHQKALIARCLANTACLQISGGLYEKAMRTLRKAHKTAVALRCVGLWTRILGLLASLYANPENPQYNPARANLIYRRLLAVYERYGMKLERAQMLSQYAEFLLRTHQNMAALNAYRMARGIYLRLGLEIAAEKVEVQMEQMMRDNALMNS